MATIKTKDLIEERPVHKHQPNSRLTKDGREILDSTPMAPPLGFIQQPSIQELMRMMILEHDRQKQGGLDPESFEEADDFDIDDEDDAGVPRGNYEHNFDHMSPEDRAAVQNTLTPAASQAIDEEIASLQRPRQTSTRKAPMEGAAEGSPDTPSDAPAGPLQRVREHFRRPPTRNGDPPTED